MKRQFLIGIMTTPILILSTGPSFAEISMHSAPITRNTVANSIQQSDVNLNDLSLNQPESRHPHCPPRFIQGGCGGW
jgi:hypothetical protein